VNALVDTSVWSLALRRRARDLSVAEQAAVAELGELIREGRARMIGLVRQELLSGIRTQAQFEKLRGILRSFDDEPVDTSDYEAAAEASNKCRSRGVAVSVSDMLICAISLSRGWSIFTTDPDFRNYAKVLGMNLHAPRK
jgi:predicted nucleic acid-binding protein